MTPIIDAYSKHKIGVFCRETPWENLDHTPKLHLPDLRSHPLIRSAAPGVRAQGCFCEAVLDTFFVLGRFLNSTSALERIRYLA
jgi:hypothetical protein